MTADGNCIKLFDLAQLASGADDALVATVPGGVAPVKSVAFTGDGLLAILTDDAVTHLWSADGQVCLRTIGAPCRKADFMALPQRGALLATASYTGSTQLWDAETGQHRGTIQRSFGVNALACSPDGQHVATCARSCSARVWGTTDFGCHAVLTGHSGAINAVKFSADGQRIATAARDGLAKVWDAATGSCLMSLAGHGDQVNDVAFSSDGQLLATVSDDGTATVWSAEDGTHVRTLRGHTDGICTVVFAPAAPWLTALVPATDALA